MPARIITPFVWRQRRKREGFDTLRARNRAAWDELWKGRIVLQRRGRLLAGPRRRRLLLPQRLGASLVALVDLDLRLGHLARLPLLLRPRDVGHRGLRRPAALLASARRGRARCSTTGRGTSPAPSATPSSSGAAACSSPGRARRAGEESAPMPGTAAWHEDHVSLDVAHAFARFADVTGDERVPARPGLARAAGRGRVADHAGDEDRDGLRHRRIHGHRRARSSR